MIAQRAQEDARKALSAVEEVKETVRLDRVEARLDPLEAKVDEGFSMVAVGMSEIAALIKNVERRL